MSTAEMRRLAKHSIDALPPERLRSVMDFIGYVSKQSDDAGVVTRRPFSQRLAQARRDAKAGKLISTSSLRRKYA